ncbi:DNA-directed RNA polymerase, omega subunit [Marvinbryantia formatexigens DSM 14469]|uniref:DNA-directed RNA polymerase subunit omega n=1 Tax=Marvinbryantia formatexigens DSM 14469 TaxID=478749 RepID=C6LCV7_9FIRM|nr:DNA-directed RNA polymerase subunit omega [Marvinbryantia formatexigens]EET61771.1 DNA-directed RNA polymerase, omega subunit [Marvinbryantia formatexigens DSM 14469]UWO24421.1 DNA-directed RNA polymerase subunit omega [Marvinbryantia formatexigens DSM 14469]SDF06883.1 RNA polymerase Rpb6 [Marvinbryantia formatexigens]
MLHPSYAELIKVVNSEAEAGEEPVVNSRYSIVLATAKRARQLIDGRKPLSMPAINKPLSIAVDELSKGLIKILPEDAAEELEISEMQEEVETAEAAEPDAAEETAAQSEEEPEEEASAQEQQED